MIPAIVVGWLAVGFWAHDYLINKILDNYKNKCFLIEKL